MKNSERIINSILIIITIIATAFLGWIFYGYITDFFSIDNDNQLVIFSTNEIENESDEKISVEPENIQQIKPVGSSAITAHNTISSNIQSTSRYYYNQLDEYSKVIYDAFENNIENLKTGTYKIQFGNEFDSLLKQENGTELLNNKFQVAWDAFYYDRPDVFYLDATKFSLMVQTIKRGLKTSYSVYIDNGENSNYLQEPYTSKEQIDNIINELENLKVQFKTQMSNMSSNQEKIKALHDWIVENVEYDINFENVNRYTIRGALLDKKAVCEGYAKIFKYILDSINIENVLVSGMAFNAVGKAEKHMWNYVNLDGVWYGVDCTWDDPVTEGNGRITNEIRYKYFLKGREVFNTDHQTEPITPNNNVLKYPEL